MDAAGSAFLHKINDIGVNEWFPARESDMGNAEVSEFINSQQPFLLIDKLLGFLLPDVAEAAFSNAYIGKGKFRKAHGTVKKRLEYVFVFWVHRIVLNRCTGMGAPVAAGVSNLNFQFAIWVSMNCTSNRLRRSPFLSFFSDRLPAIRKGQLCLLRALKDPKAP